MQLSRHLRTIQLLDALTAGSTTNDNPSATVDLTGYVGMRARCTVGSVSTAVTLTVQTSTSTTAGDFSSVTSAATAASTVSNIEHIVDVYRPTKRYGRVLLNSTGGNLSGPVMVDLYGARVMPTTNGSTSVAEAIVVST